MADYFDIEDSEIDPLAPLSSFLGYRFRDNPVAMAQGHDDAPRVMPAALSLHLGTINTGTNESSPAGLIDLDAIDILEFNAAVTGDSSGLVKGFRLSTNNGASWTGWATSLIGAGQQVRFVNFQISLRGLWWRTVGLSAGDGAVNTSGSIGAGVNAIQWRAFGTIAIYAKGRSIGL